MYFKDIITHLKNNRRRLHQNIHFINKWEDNIKTEVKEIMYGRELETSEKGH
jgi:hypothetical protein